MKRDYEVDLNKLRVELAARYPNLQLYTGDGGPILRGSLPIEHAGREIDRFFVEIDLRTLCTRELPAVRETAGRIPHETRRHVNAKDGTACVCIPADYFVQHPGPFDVMAFLDGPVMSYFIGQALVEQGDTWPQGEWGHGADGLVQWGRKFFGCASRDEVLRFLEIMAVREMKGHLVCPCGSGVRIRKCHVSQLRLLREQLTPDRARNLLEQIKQQGRSAL